MLVKISGSFQTVRRAEERLEGKIFSPLHSKAPLKSEWFLVPSCVMKPILFLFACIALAAHGQQSNAEQHNQTKADSIVMYFLGQDNFQKYVTLNSVEIHDKDTTLASRLFLYEYHFRHPKFSGNIFFITISLDTNGQFIPYPQTRGVVDATSINDSTTVNAQRALELCNDEHHRRIKKKSLRLAWDAVDVSYDTFQKTHNLRDIVPGRIVWQVDGTVEFRGDVYSGMFQVDLLTGTVGRHFAIPWD